MAIAKEEVLRDVQRRLWPSVAVSVVPDTSPGQWQAYRSLLLRASQTSPTANTAGTVLGLQSTTSIGRAPAESPLVKFRDEAVATAHLAIDDPSNGLTRDVSLCTRLHELVAMAQEEYPETGIPSPTAIGALGRLLAESAGTLRAPSISLLPSGALWLGWRSDGARAGMALFPDGSASLGLVLPGTVRKSHVNFSGAFDEVLGRMMAERGPHSTIPQS